LRAWLRARTADVPASLVERLIDELRAEATLRWPIEGGELRSYRGRLHHETTRATPASQAAAQVADLSSAGVHRFAPWCGAIVVEPVIAGGIPLATAARLELRERAGGERFQVGPGRPPRHLKLQYQAAGVPAWQLVWHEAGLVFVPGLGIDARVMAAPGEPQVSLAWQADQDPSALPRSRPRR
jgi:tRNA(Ile)-lysidine synthase